MSGDIEAIVRIIREIAEAASDLAEFRHKLLERVEKGDLDDAVSTFISANKRASDFIEGGT